MVCDGTELKLERTVCMGQRGMLELAASRSGWHPWAVVVERWGAWVTVGGTSPMGTTEVERGCAWVAQMGALPCS
jgi:hypothetical protein